jgi:transposase InsO family protein
MRLQRSSSDISPTRSRFNFDGSPGVVTTSQLFGPSKSEEIRRNQPHATRWFRDECLNEHWFPSLLHARTEIETWRREYNEERPKKALGGLTPADYAKQLK